MQITSLWETLTRRWLPLLIVVLAGIGLGLGAWMRTEVKYNAETVIVVLPPAIPGQAEEGNPLSRVSFDSTEMSTLVVTLLNSPAVSVAMAQQGGSLVSVDNLLSTTSPNPQRTMRVTIIAEGADPESAVATARAAVTATQTEFARFQTENLKVAPQFQSTLAEMVAAHPVASDRTSKLRAGAGTMLGVIGLGVVSVLAFDLIMAARERRRLGLDERRHRQPAAS